MTVAERFGNVCLLKVSTVRRCDIDHVHGVSENLGGCEE